MVKNTFRKKASIALLILLVILGLAWVIVSYQIEKKIEKTLHQTLEKHDLQDQVQWHSISVSPLKTVTLKNVVYQPPGGLQYQANKIRISDVINQPDRLRIHLQILQMLPVIPASKSNPQSTDINMQVDLDFAKDTGRITGDAQVQHGYDFDFHWEISKIAVLRRMLKQRFPYLALSTEGASGNAVFGLLAVSFNSLEARWDDRGAAAKQLSNTPKEGEDNDIIGQLMRGTMQTLEKGCAYAIPDMAQSCQHLIDFAQGKKSSLHLTATPAQPLPLWQFVRLNQAKSLRALNIHTK